MIEVSFDTFCGLSLGFQFAGGKDVDPDEEDVDFYILLELLVFRVIITKLK